MPPSLSWQPKISPGTSEMFCCKGGYETPPIEWSLDLRFKYNSEMSLNLNSTDFLFQHNNQATWREASPEGSVCVLHIRNCWFKQISAEVDSSSSLDFGSVSSQYVFIHFSFFIESYFLPPSTFGQRLSDLCSVSITFILQRETICCWLPKQTSRKLALLLSLDFEKKGPKLGLKRQTNAKMGQTYLHSFSFFLRKNQIIRKLRGGVPKFSPDSSSAVDMK